MIVGFSVYGIPKGQGNLTVRGGRAVEGKTHSAASAFASWRSALIDKARAAAERVGQFPDGPLEVWLTFFLPRPASKKKAAWCITKPDIDKLERAVLDALTLSGLIVDDSRVCRVVKDKPYAIDHPPRVDVTVVAMADVPRSWVLHPKEDDRAVT